MSEFICEPLAKRHDRQQFDCGDHLLNEYLLKTASQDVRRKASAAFVLAPSSDPSRIVGFYTLSATSLELSVLPSDLVNQLPRYPEVPAILIGRLARDVNFRGTGFFIALGCPGSLRSSSQGGCRDGNCGRFKR